MIELAKHPPFLISLQNSSHSKQNGVEIERRSFQKRGRFPKATSVKTFCLYCRWPRVSTISFWISALMFWFFIRRSKTADLVRNLVYIILDTECFIQNFFFIKESVILFPVLLMSIREYNYNFMRSNDCSIALDGLAVWIFCNKRRFS